MSGRVGRGCYFVICSALLKVDGLDSLGDYGCWGEGLYVGIQLHCP